MCLGNKFLNNSIKIMKVYGFGARFFHYFINCLLLCFTISKANYLSPCGMCCLVTGWNPLLLPWNTLSVLKGKRYKSLAWSNWVSQRWYHKPKLRFCISLHACMIRVMLTEQNIQSWICVRLKSLFCNRLWSINSPYLMNLGLNKKNLKKGIPRRCTHSVKV